MQNKALILAAIAALPLGLTQVSAEVKNEVAQPFSQADHLARAQDLTGSQAVYSSEDAFDVAVDHLLSAAQGSDAVIANEANLELGILYFNSLQSIQDAERAVAMSGRVTRLFSDVSQNAEGNVQETATALLSMHALNTGDIDLAGNCVRKLDVTHTQIPALPMIVRSYHLAQGEPLQAKSALEEMTLSAKNESVQAEAMFALGELLVGMGELEAAQERLADAANRFRSLGNEQDAAEIEQYYLAPLRNAKDVALDEETA